EKFVFDEIQNIFMDLPSLVGCDEAKRAIQKSWHAYSFPITNDYAPIGINVTPTEIGLSKIENLEDRVHFAFRVSAKTEIEAGSSNGKGKPIALPPLTQIPSTSHGFQVSVPVRLGYAELRMAATNALKDTTFTNKTPVGEVLVRVKDVEFF